MSPITVVFFGKSGSGKGTQSALLLKTLERVDSNNKAVYIETGREFRDFTKSNAGFLAKKTLEVMTAGKFMPPFLPIWAWTELFVQNLVTGAEHMIFDGVSRQPEEAPILDQALKFLDRGKPFVILLDAKHETVTDRLLKRGRFDDKPEKIVERLNAFETQAMPAVNHFKSSPNVAFVTIDGDQSIEKVHEDVLKAIGIAGRL